jgi:uncharacterized protein DUF4157
MPGADSVPGSGRLHLAGRVRNGEKRARDVEAGQAASARRSGPAAPLRPSGHEVPGGVFAAVKRAGGRQSLAQSAVHLLELQRLAGNRAVRQLLRKPGRSSQRAAGNGAPPRSNAAVVQRAPEDEPLQAGPESAAPRERSGMSDQLKSGIEALSGIDLSNVHVHTNSDKPAQVKALAYARGNEIHVAPGQEQHMPHEAWHIVQQAQGRVKPTMQMSHGVPVNDEEGLEREADVMAGKALSGRGESPFTRPAAGRSADPARAGPTDFARPDHRPIQRVGEQKTDFAPAGTDSQAYRDGLALFQKALKELQVLRKGEKTRIWGSIEERKEKERKEKEEREQKKKEKEKARRKAKKAAKAKPARESVEALPKVEIKPEDKSEKKEKKLESFSKAYGGRLRGLNNLDLLVKTPQFAAAAPPRLVLDGKQVLYQQSAGSDGTQPTERVLIATLSDRTFPELPAQPKEARREVKEAQRGVVADGAPRKEYVLDQRGVATRRFAYVEKNYWQFMEFVARNKLEGRYQNFFRAANPGTDRPSVHGARPSEAKTVGAKSGKALTDEQLAVLHQWGGSGLQQRGLSLTSTPRKGEVIGNAGENFRTEVGVRLTIDLARIPTGPDSPIMLNHYAHGGVKDKGKSPVPKEEVYPYLDSVIKNRELFLEFVKPEWITNIEYHDKSGGKEFKLEDSANASAMMDAARSGTGYQMFADGFEAKIAEPPAPDPAKAGDPDYKKGKEFADEYNKGYAKGLREDKVERKGAASVDPLEEIGGFNPKEQPDIFAIGRIHARLRREKPKNLPAVWT